MDEGKVLLELIKEFERFSFWGGFGMLILILGFVFLFIFLKSKIEKAGEEAAEKSMAKFEAYLKNNLETQMKFLFRNEAIRNDIMMFTAKKSIDKKIEVWQETYGLYFDYIGTSVLSESDFKKLLIDSLDKKYADNRQKIFMNSIYLGGELTSNLITLNTSMRSYLREKVRFNEAYNDQLKRQSEEIMRRFNDRIETLTNGIEKWLAKNINVDYTTASYEFTEDQLRTIKEQIDMSFGEINVQKL